MQPLKPTTIKTTRIPLLAALAMLPGLPARADLGDTLLHLFAGGPADGAMDPFRIGPMALSGTTLYGMTSSGGAGDHGTIFQL